MYKLDKTSRLAGRRFTTSDFKRWMSVEAHTPRNGEITQETSPVSDTITDRQAGSVGTETLSQQLLREMKLMNTEMEGRLRKDINKLKEDLSEDINKVKDDLSKDINKVKEDLSKDISTVAIGHGKIFAGATVLATMSAAILVLLRYFDK